MAGISIFLIIAFLLFFILTRETRIKLTKYDILKIELHFQIVALVFINKKKNGDNKHNKSRSTTRREKRRIITTLFRVLKRGELFVFRLALPYEEIGGNIGFSAGHIGYNILLSSLISYFETKTKRLIVADDAIVFSPDVTSFQYDVTLKCKLYELIYAIVTLAIGIWKERKRKYVRE